MKKILITLVFLTTLISVANAQQTRAKKEFSKILEAYFDTKNALATDKAQLAGSSAYKLLGNLKTFPTSELAPVQQKEWKQQTIALTNLLSPMATEKDLKAQRKNFENVSSAMIKLVRTFALADKKVYVQYCPMVKRSWLNEVEEVQNPYYGSKMYDCGEVTETL